MPRESRRDESADGDGDEAREPNTRELGDDDADGAAHGGGAPPDRGSTWDLTHVSRHTTWRPRGRSHKKKPTRVAFSSRRVRERCRQVARVTLEKENDASGRPHLILLTALLGLFLRCHFSITCSR